MIANYGTSNYAVSRSVHDSREKGVGPKDVALGGGDV